MRSIPCPCANVTHTSACNTQQQGNHGQSRSVQPQASPAPPATAATTATVAGERRWYPRATYHHERQLPIVGEDRCSAGPPATHRSAGRTGEHDERPEDQAVRCNERHPHRHKHMRCNRDARVHDKGHMDTAELAREKAPATRHAAGTAVLCGVNQLLQLRGSERCALAMISGRRRRTSDALRGFALAHGCDGSLKVGATHLHNVALRPGKTMFAKTHTRKSFSGRRVCISCSAV